MNPHQSTPANAGRNAGPGAPVRDSDAAAPSSAGGSSHASSGGASRASAGGSSHVSARTRIGVILPGISLCVVAATAAYVVGNRLLGISPLLVAIVFGVLAANLIRLPAAMTPGISFTSKTLLRAGIVLLGLQLVLGDIVALGAPMLFVVVCIVGGGLFGTVMLGRILGVPSRLALLVACGFSICGAAAVAGAAGVIDPDDEAEEDTVTAVALVVVFGTLMILFVPLLTAMFGMDPHTAGLWAGGSIHEIAQVVAVGGIIGSGALTVAVVVKLARVLMLAPVLAILSIRERRIRALDSTSSVTSTAISADPAATSAGPAATSAGPAATSAAPAATRLPPIVPLFVVGFLAMVLVRSFLPLPESVLSVGQVLQTGLLAAAMFGLGCGVRVSGLARIGPRPFVLAACSTVLVATIAYLGITLVV